MLPRLSLPVYLPVLACLPAAMAARLACRFGPLVDTSVVPKQRIGFLTFAKGDDGERCLEAVNGTSVRAPRLPARRRCRQMLLLLPPAAAAPAAAAAAGVLPSTADASP